MVTFDLVDEVNLLIDQQLTNYIRSMGYPETREYKYSLEIDKGGIKTVDPLLFYTIMDEEGLC